MIADLNQFELEELEAQLYSQVYHNADAVENTVAEQNQNSPGETTINNDQSKQTVTSKRYYTPNNSRSRYSLTNSANSLSSINLQSTALSVNDTMSNPTPTLPQFVQNIVNVSPIIQIQQPSTSEKVVMLPNNQMQRLFMTEDGEWLSKSQIRKRKRVARMQSNPYGFGNQKGKNAKKFATSTPNHVNLKYPQFEKPKEPTSDHVIFISDEETEILPQNTPQDATKTENSEISATIKIDRDSNSSEYDTTFIKQNPDSPMVKLPEIFENDDEDDDDVIFIEPKPVEVINVDVDVDTTESIVDIESKTLADADANLLKSANSSTTNSTDSTKEQITPRNRKARKRLEQQMVNERNELLSTPDSTLSNDFIDNSVIKEKHKFNFGLHEMDLRNISRDKNQAEIYETESSCSASDFGTPSKPPQAIFEENEFDALTRPLFAADLQNFGDFITPRRPENLEDIPSCSNSANLHSLVPNNDLIVNEISDSSGSSSESEYDEQTPRKRRNRLPSLAAIPPCENELNLGGNKGKKDSKRSKNSKNLQDSNKKDGGKRLITKSNEPEFDDEPIAECISNSDDDMHEEDMEQNVEEDVDKNESNKKQKKNKRSKNTTPVPVEEVVDDINEHSAEENVAIDESNKKPKKNRQRSKNATPVKEVNDENTDEDVNENLAEENIVVDETNKKSKRNKQRSKNATPVTEVNDEDTDEDSEKLAEHFIIVDETSKKSKKDKQRSKNDTPVKEIAQDDQKRKNQQESNKKDNGKRKKTKSGNEENDKIDKKAENTDENNSNTEDDIDENTMEENELLENPVANKNKRKSQDYLASSSKKKSRKQDDKNSESRSSKSNSDGDENMEFIVEEINTESDLNKKINQDRESSNKEYVVEELDNDDLRQLLTDKNIEKDLENIEKEVKLETGFVVEELHEEHTPNFIKKDFLSLDVGASSSDDEEVQIIEPKISVVELSEDDDDIESLNIETDLSFPNCSFNLNEMRNEKQDLTKTKEDKKNFSDFFTADMNKFYNSSWGLENFSVTEAQKTMSDDPEKWKILDRDRNAAKVPTPRGKRCYHCRDKGHYQSECPHKKGPLVCKLCGKKGHQEKRCKNRLCANCGKKGPYTSVYCQHCANDRSVKCKICKCIGHTPNRCPDLWRRYIYTTKKGSLVEFNGLKLKPPPQRWCSGCAERGHFEFQCVNYNRCHLKIDPSIRNFEDVYDANFDPYKNIRRSAENLNRSFESAKTNQNQAKTNENQRRNENNRSFDNQRKTNEFQNRSLDNERETNESGGPAKHCGWIILDGDKNDVPINEKTRKEHEKAIDERSTVPANLRQNATVTNNSFATTEMNQKQKRFIDERAQQNEDSLESLLTIRSEINKTMGNTNTGNTQANVFNIPEYRQQFPQNKPLIITNPQISHRNQLILNLGQQLSNAIRPIPNQNQQFPNIPPLLNPQQISNLRQFCPPGPQFQNKNQQFGNRNQFPGHQQFPSNKQFGNRNQQFGNKNQQFGNNKQQFGNNQQFGNRNQQFTCNNPQFANKQQFGNKNQQFPNRNQLPSNKQSFPNNFEMPECPPPPSLGGGSSQSNFANISGENMLNPAYKSIQRQIHNDYRNKPSQNIQELHHDETYLIYYLNEPDAEFLLCQTPGKDFISDLQRDLGVAISIIIERENKTCYVKISGKPDLCNFGRETIDRYVQGEMQEVKVPQNSKLALKFLQRNLFKCVRASNPHLLLSNLVNLQLDILCENNVKKICELRTQLRNLYLQLNISFYSKYDISNSQRYMEILQNAVDSYKDGDGYELNALDRDNIQHSFNFVFYNARSISEYENCLKHIKNVSPKAVSIDYTSKKAMLNATKQISEKMRHYESVRNRENVPGVILEELEKSYVEFRYNPNFYLFDKFNSYYKHFLQWSKKASPYKR